MQFSGSPAMSPHLVTGRVRLFLSNWFSFLETLISALFLFSAKKVMLVGFEITLKPIKVNKYITEQIRSNRYFVRSTRGPVFRHCHAASKLMEKSLKLENFRIYPFINWLCC